MTRTMLEAALEYARAGIPVFPLVPRTKEPFRGSHGFQDATCDESAITRWWSETPDANIGARTGGGLLVIDIDVDDERGEDGMATLRAFEREHGELPETVSAVTGRGGAHLWYRTGCTVTNSANPEAGVDVRGDGGFVVMPPSIHPNGRRYEWESGPDEREMAEADDAVLAFINSTRPVRRGRPRTREPEEVGEGGRNDYLYRYGCSLRADEANTDDVIIASIEARNTVVCKPPLDAGEVDRIVASVLALPPGYSDGVRARRKPGRFNHAAVARKLMDEHGACFVDGMPAIQSNGRYVVGWDAVCRRIIAMEERATRANQKEVQHYISVMAERVSQSPPSLIAFANGVLDTDTMELREWRGGDVIPNVIPHDWDPSARCAEVDAVLDKMACGRDDVYQSLIEVMGVCMYRSSEFTQSAILLGSGSNGKSTYIRMLQALLGKENISSLDMAMIGKQFHTGQLAGKLANLGDDISNEFQHGDILSVFKKVVDGNRIYTDVKGMEGYEFEPYATLVFSANEFPRLADYSDGMMRRIFPIEFNATFSKTDADYDPRISRKVTSEAACRRMCVLAVTGLARVMARNGFTPNAASTRRVEEIRADNDTVLAWVLDAGWTAETIDGGEIARLYQVYRGWCDDSGLQAVKRTKFTRGVNGHLGVSTGVCWVAGRSVRAFVKNV